MLDPFLMRAGKIKKTKKTMYGWSHGSMTERSVVHKEANKTSEQRNVVLHQVGHVMLFYSHVSARYFISTVFLFATHEPYHSLSENDLRPPFQLGQNCLCKTTSHVVPLNAHTQLFLLLKFILKWSNFVN